MVDEQQQTENSAINADGEGIEELHVADAAVDIDFEQDLETSGAAASGNADLANLERQLAELKAQLEDRTNQSMRIAADFENYRKRTSKEKEDLEAQVKGTTIMELLPVVDNFERARSQIKPQTEAEMTIHKSYQSVYKQLVETLKRLGVSAMRAEGQEFNPALHEAVMREPTRDYPEGVVMEELVRGYQLGERVLRHAMVKVAAPPEDGAEPAQTEGEVSAS
ncbi:MAG TPA: nucleotide exchange factor GrpE [Leptolyngbyaceae cyanobacterium M65_K2018_010]|nr:nucleotide exchange factor GrpE [Leptolyngbyaceae cyanobacterium M65_K2018_010]